MNTNLVSSNITNSAEIALGEDILGIRGPVDIPTGWEWLWWLLGVLLAATLLYFLIKKLLKKVKIVHPPRIPYVAPHTLARRRLNDAMRLIGDPYRFCSAISGALREYVEGRFSIHAPDRTTDEFIEELRNDSSLNSDQQNLVASFLNQCDLVKFAKEEPAQDQLQNLHSTALRLVEETIPGPEDVALRALEEVAK